MEFPEILGNLPCQAEQEERADVLSQGGGNDQRQQGGEAGGFDSTVEPDVTGLGAVPPHRISHEGVQPHGALDLSKALAVVEEAASAEKCWLGAKEVFPHSRRTKLGVCGSRNER